MLFFFQSILSVHFYIVSIGGWGGGGVVSTLWLSLSTGKFQTHLIVYHLFLFYLIEQIADIERNVYELKGSKQQVQMTLYTVY